MNKILAWDMFDRRYVGDVNENGNWFNFAIVIRRYPNKTYSVDTWESDNINEEVEFMEPTYQELKLYSEKLLNSYRNVLDDNYKLRVTTKE